MKVKPRTEGPTVILNHFVSRVEIDGLQIVFFNVVSALHINEHFVSNVVKLLGLLSVKF